MTSRYPITTYDLQGWPKDLVMGCENFQNLCVVIGGTIGGVGRWRFLPLSLSLSLSLPANLPSFPFIICNGVSLFHRPFNELDRYRSGIIARRIDGGKSGSSTRHADKNKMRRRRTRTGGPEKLTYGRAEVSPRRRHSGFPALPFVRLSRRTTA